MNVYCDFGGEDVACTASFDIQVIPPRRCDCRWCAIVFHNGDEVGSCNLSGKCSITVDHAPFGVQIWMVGVVSPPDALPPDKTLSCALAFEMDLGECWGLVSAFEIKGHMEEPTLLSPTLPLDAIEFVTGRKVGPRPMAIVNEYEVNEDGSLLFDPIIASNCTEIVIVSPLRDQDRLHLLTW